MSNTNAGARRRVAILIIPLLLCVAVACSQQSSNNSDPTPVISGPPSTTFPMPPVTSDGSGELRWTLSDGERISLSEQRGKVVVLDFYATWCEPCRQSIPHLISLHERYKEKGLVLVGLNVGGPDDRVKVLDFAKQLSISYPLGFPDKALTDLLISDNNRIPQTFVFGRDGQLMKRYIGYDDSIPGQLEQLIQSVLAASPK